MAVFFKSILDRPSLKASLCDVESGIVNMIVVYQIDRLARSLSDFIKLQQEVTAERFCDKITAFKKLGMCIERVVQ